jgi:hypothetical protein
MIDHAYTRRIRTLAVVSIVLGALIMNGSLALAAVAPAEPVVSDSIVTPVNYPRERPGIIGAPLPEREDHRSAPSASSLTGIDQMRFLEDNGVYISAEPAAKTPPISCDWIMVLEEEIAQDTQQNPQLRSAQDIQFVDENGVVIATFPIECESDSPAPSYQGEQFLHHDR